MDHCPTNQLDRANLLHIGDRADHGLDAHAGQPAELPDQLARPGAVFAYVEAESTSLLDGVVVAALGLAVLAQDRQLLRNLRPGAQRTGVRVARHQPQRLLRAFAGDEDRRVRGAPALRYRVLGVPRAEFAHRKWARPPPPPPPYPAKPQPTLQPVA